MFLGGELGQNRPRCMGLLIDFTLRDFSRWSVNRNKNFTSKEMNVNRFIIDEFSDADKILSLLE